jgi:acyl carrier protein phosphodiesterase
MNFLAHLYLSGDDEQLVVGNFIADHVKGNNVFKYSDGIQKGIRLHREIDTFTDAHPIFLQSKSRLADSYRKYAGVVVDMFYDHFLSANWTSYSAEDMESFVDRIHDIIVKRYPILPHRSQQFVAYMKKFNWLSGYGTIGGLTRALRGMANRTPFESKMEQAVKDLTGNYEVFKQEFQEFFPQIIDHTGEYLNKF